ncbi:diguanylate cyclase (GGDEF) domain-containing protein [Asanoa hainanensis]|uniref:Diguanylate cyclase (GGDEF) domain-containing protein n=1 Tax=Asanoa hainanensis TaxID=560556 RepID=A0A239IYQ1_9ACTN|nr:GGDEF domain-containing protein [Asanoa hainanensis]SNS98689.1 diguanylate cyclase (GGDEF) domain-containing protein [Asanoa hainanensis]
MFPLLALIATSAAGFALGLLTSWPFIRRMRQQIVDVGELLIRDRLTGLYNRDGLLAAHSVAIHSTRRTMILVLLDLDNFKVVNDTWGHDAGDSLLTTVAERIRDVAAAFGGTAARLSGDEYAAHLPAGDHQLRHVGQAFIARIAQPTSLTVNGATITLTPTVSAGLALADPSDPIEHVVLRRADAAMYHAKHNDGGNSYAVYQLGMTMPTAAGRRGLRPRDRRDGSGRA